MKLRFLSLWHKNFFLGITKQRMAQTYSLIKYITVWVFKFCKVILTMAWKIWEREETKSPITPWYKNYFHFWDHLQIIVLLYTVKSYFILKTLLQKKNIMSVSIWNLIIFPHCELHFLNFWRNLLYFDKPIVSQTISLAQLLTNWIYSGKSSSGGFFLMKLWKR